MAPHVAGQHLVPKAVGKTVAEIDDRARGRLPVCVIGNGIYPQRRNMGELVSVFVAVHAALADVEEVASDLRDRHQRLAEVVEVDAPGVVAAFCVGLEASALRMETPD